MKKVTPHTVNRTTSKKRQHLTRAAAVIFWLAVWAAAAKLIDRELFLPGPLLVFSSLIKLISSEGYFAAIGNSMFNIISGYLLAIIAGTLLAILSCQVRPIKAFISLPLRVIRTIPVASFIILALLWFSSKRLALVISFLMVVPIIYENVLEGLESTDAELLEMAYLVKMPLAKKIKLIYLPHLSPQLFAALSTGAGLAWKSGIAAEVIGISRNTIGNRLYQSKIYLDTPELFAWTLTIISISLAFECGIRALLRLIQRRGVKKG